MSFKPKILTLIVDGIEQEEEKIELITLMLEKSKFSCDCLFMFSQKTVSDSTITTLRVKSKLIPVHYIAKITELEIDQIETEWVGVIPKNATLSLNLPVLKATDSLAPWIDHVDFPKETAFETSHTEVSWLIIKHLFELLIPWLIEPKDMTFLNVGMLLEERSAAFHWNSANQKSSPHTFLNFSRTPYNQKTVLAVVPHYKCETWLTQCLRSLVNQTRPLDGIVVIDDGLKFPPIQIVRNFPEVTLLYALTRAGPYQLIQQVIEMTDYWAYLFQDADDWSSYDRLETILNIANSTQANLVGTQEIRVYEEESRISLCYYPLNVNLALTKKLGHPLLHPTSLVTRELVIQLGGFSTGLRFGGDTEFLLRAKFIATIRNSQRFCYFRRKRVGSLTTDSLTGLYSPARKALLKQIKERASKNLDSVGIGKPPDLTPIAKARSVNLYHLTGPHLKWLLPP